MGSDGEKQIAAYDQSLKVLRAVPTRSPEQQKAHGLTRDDRIFLLQSSLLLRREPIEWSMRSLARLMAGIGLTGEHHGHYWVAVIELADLLPAWDPTEDIAGLVAVTTSAARAARSAFDLFQTSRRHVLAELSIPEYLNGATPSFEHDLELLEQLASELSWGGRAMSLEQLRARADAVMPAVQRIASALDQGGALRTVLRGLCHPVDPVLAAARTETSELTVTGELPRYVITHEPLEYVLRDMIQNAKTHGGGVNAIELDASLAQKLFIRVFAQGAGPTPEDLRMGRNLGPHDRELRRLGGCLGCDPRSENRAACVYIMAWSLK
jgi:hypothetical protein